MDTPWKTYLDDTAGNRRVLIIDDDLQYAESLNEILNAVGYQTAVGHTGAEAQELIRTFDAQIALVDVRLGKDSGVELIGRLKELRPRTLYLLMTAFADAESAIAAFHEGAYDYLQKPLQPRDLLSVLDHSYEKLRLEAEKAKTEEALRKSEEKMSKVFQASPDSIVITRLSDGMVLEVNDHFTEAMGYSREEAVGYSVNELKYWANREERQKFIAALKEKGAVSNFESTFRSHDGNFLPGLTSARIIELGGENCVLSITRNISELKKVENDLRESERRYRLLAENVNDIIWTINLDLKFTYVSPLIEHFLGYTVEEATRLSIQELLTPESYTYGMNLIAEELAKENDPQEDIFRTRTLELEHRCKDGSSLWMELNVSADRDAEQNLIGFRGVTRDISARKKAETELLKARDTAQKYLDIAGVVLLALNEQGEVILINRKGCEVLGYTENELKGENWFKTVLPAGRREEVFRVFKKIIAGNYGFVLDYENEIITKSGEERVFAWHNTPVLDETGGIIGTLSSGEDITERKQVQEKLHRQTQELIARVTELNCLYSISHLAEREGWKLEEKLQKVVELLPLAWRHPDAAAARITLEGQWFQTPNFIKTSWRQAAPLTLQGKEIGKLEVGYVKDYPPLDEGPFSLDERKLINAIAKHLGEIIEVERGRERLMQAEKMAAIGGLATEVAHSIRNPLTSINLRLFSLQRALSSSPAMKEDLEIIAEEIRRLDNFICNFLEFSRPPKIKKATFNLTDLIRKTIELFKHRMELLGIELAALNLGKLPELEADPELIKDVLANLLVNAFEAMSGGGRLTVATEDVRKDGQRAIIIRVGDTGPGVPAALRQKIWHPFFSSKEHGTGLGLPIARRIIAEHGGRLELESGEGPGAIFRITLPIEEK